MTPHEETVEQLDFLTRVRKRCVAGSWKEPARRLSEWLDLPWEYTDEESAREVVRRDFYYLLDNDCYLLASALAWTRGMFEQRPKHMAQVFDLLTEKDLLILIGASSLSKSYGGTGWLALDWLRDPTDTGIKFGSTDAANVRGNLWANFREFCQRSLFRPEVIQVNESKTSLVLKVHGSRPDTGISAVFFSRTETSQGKVKGIHPKPLRPETHPTWGDSTRMRIFLDECLPYHTPVLLADGSSLPIGQIVERRLPVEVLSFDTKTGKQRPGKVVAWQKLPNRKPLVKVAVTYRAQGRQWNNFVVCTEDHRLWTNNRGYVEAAKLTLEDVMQVETSARRSQKYKMTGKGRIALGLLRATRDRTSGSAGFITVRGGNGRGATKEERALCAALGAGFELNHVVAVKPRRRGYPTNFKIDIANPSCRIAVEVDGQSHGTHARQAQDRRKQQFLEDQGWRVYRFSNREAWQDPDRCAREVLADGECPVDAQIVSIDPVSIRDDWVYDVTVEDTHNFYANGILSSNCQNLFGGVKKDFGSPKSTLDPRTHVMKIILTANPEDVQKWVVQLAEPPCGWCEEVTETMWEWPGKEGFHVLRLDGARFENVVQRKIVFPGWLTYEGFTSHLANGVEPTADYYIYGRGVPPPGQKSKVVIPTEWFDTSIGEPIYSGPVQPIAGGDLAYVRDKGILAVGRYGMATGWRDSKGEEHLFNSRQVMGQTEMRHCAVLDQLIHLRGKDPVAIVEEIKAFCQACGVGPEFLCLDKMQPVSEPVATPSGWRPIGELKVGDLVIGSDGQPTRVTGVYPQKDRRVVRVWCSDGSWTRCGPEHLWTVEDRLSGRRITVTTEELSDLLVEQGSQRRWIVPMLSAPVEYEPQPDPPLDGYLLGALLGDGNLRDNSIRFSSVDDEILAHLRAALPAGYELKHTDRCNYAIQRIGWKSIRDTAGRFGGRHEILEGLRTLGLAGKRSYEKWIPEQYKRGSVATRLAILQGLMDTDGYAAKESTVQFRSCSQTLADDVAEIVESLGGSVRRRAYATSHRRAYVVTIRMPSGLSPFRLSRKKKRLHPRKRRTVRVVDRIEAAPDEKSVCIRVEAPDHLYATRHMLLTHNTGNGYGIWSTAVKWGNVLGMNWKESPTKNKMLAEDKHGADEQVFNKISEIMWTLRLWMQPTVRAFFINPVCESRDRIRLQMTSRYWRYGPKSRILVESKEDYVKRGHESPDEFDATAMMGLIPRHHSMVLPAMIDETAPARGRAGAIMENRTAPVESGLPAPEWQAEESLYPDGDEVIDTLRLTG